MITIDNIVLLLIIIAAIRTSIVLDCAITKAITRRRAKDDNAMG